MGNNARIPKASNQMPMRGGGGFRNMGVERAKLKNTKGTLRELWSYMKEKQTALIFAVVIIVINCFCAALGSYMLRPIVNGILEKTGIVALIKNLGIMAGIYLTVFVTNFIQNRMMLKIAQDTLAKIRGDLFCKLQTLPLKYFDTTKSGDTMSRFTNDVDAISQMLSQTFVQVIWCSITITTSAIIMFYTNWILALVTVVIVPLFAGISKLISKYSMKYFKAQQTTLGNLNGYMEESITGQKVIKVFNHEDDAVEDFVSLNKEYAKESLGAQFIGGMMGPLMGGLSQFSNVVTAIVGGLLCIFKGFDVGGFTIFMNFSRTFGGPINALTMQVNTIFSALAGAERVFDIIHETEEVTDEDNAIFNTEIKGDVKLNNVVFGYNSEKTILKGISLHASVGQKIAFVGSTGAGKTTITNLLNRFYDINSGEITIDGINIMSYKKEFLRQNIAMVLQDTHLFTGTVMENIRYGRMDATDEEVIEVAKIANADHFIRRLENGYQTIIDGDGSNLSQGQRQLLNIARSAISKAPILVLDEATSSVDTRTEKNIEVALDRLMQNRTTFVIAHRLSTVRNADMIMVLENGEVIESGNHDKLMAMGGKYHSLVKGTQKLS